MAFYIRLGNIVGKKENAMFKENHILYDRRIIFLAKYKLFWVESMKLIKLRDLERDGFEDIE